MTFSGTYQPVPMIPALFLFSVMRQYILLCKCILDVSEDIPPDIIIRHTDCTADGLGVRRAVADDAAAIDT